MARAHRLTCRFAALAVLTACAASPAESRGGSIIAAGGSWAALLRDGRCDAQSRIRVETGRGKAVGIAGFAFVPGGRWGAFHARLTRLPRPGSSVVATIGTRQFLLQAAGSEAWSRDPRQDEAMIAAVRSSSGMRIQARDRSGRRFTDHYSLAFAPTAIDAAAARCAALQSGQSG